MRPHSPQRIRRDAIIALKQAIATALEKGDYERAGVFAISLDRMASKAAKYQAERKNERKSTIASSHSPNHPSTNQGLHVGRAPGSQTS